MMFEQVGFGKPELMLQLEVHRLRLTVQVNSDVYSSRPQFLFITRQLMMAGSGLLCHVGAFELIRVQWVVGP